MGIYDRDCWKQLAEIAGVQQEFRSGHRTKQVDIAFAGDALVMVVHDALTTAGKKLSEDLRAANQLQAFHRELFLNSANTMKQEIARVTGRTVRESVGEIETTSAAPVCASATGLIIQVYMLNPQLISGIDTRGDQVGSDPPCRSLDPMASH